VLRVRFCMRESGFGFGGEWTDFDFEEDWDDLGVDVVDILSGEKWDIGVNVVCVDDCD